MRTDCQSAIRAADRPGWGGFADRLAVIVSTFFYVGEIRFAPGTAGTVPGLALYTLISLAVPSPLFMLCVIAVLFLLGTLSATRAERVFGQKDCSKIVIDEVVGAMITMFYLPVDWRLLVAGFLAFRFFDVAKPGFGRVQRIRGGLGVMLDDVIAGAMANASLWIALLVVTALRR